MMFLRQRNLLLLLLLSVIAACQSSQVGEQHPFTRYNYFDFEAEVARLVALKPLVEKTVLSNGNAETATDTVAWQRELALFLSSDINNSRSLDRYDIAVDERAGAANRVVTYTAKSPKEKVQLVEHTFASNQCSRVYIKRSIDNRFQETWQELTYEPGLGYHIVGHQSVKLSFDADMEIVGRFINQDKRWRGALDIKDAEIPFTFDWYTENGTPKMVMYNGAEAIEAKEVVLKGDSFEVQLPVFLSSIEGVVEGDKMHGMWMNHAKPKRYNLPFSATKGQQPRFSGSETPADFSGKWEVDFSPDTKDHYKAIGIFEQDGSTVTGTFLTETGDYRFLEGAVRGQELFLSTFDGAHAFLFTAKLTDGSIQGEFRSGKHWVEPWVASRNQQFELSNPDSLTYLVDGKGPFNFSVPDRDGNVVSLDNERYQGKVTIVQILGTWCPNCMDETAYLTQLYDAYHEKGLEIVGLCFERCQKSEQDTEKAYAAMARMRSHMGVEYPFLLAGEASKGDALKLMPMLNKIISFPTTIFIDRTGTVRKIHTGFYGPGTGDYFKRYKEHTDEFVRALLMEGES